MNPVTSRNRKALVIVLVLVLVSAIAVFYFYRLERKHQEEVSQADQLAPSLQTQDVTDRKESVRLFVFRSSSSAPGSDFLREADQEIPYSADAVMKAQAIVTAVIQESKELLPPAAHVRQVFLVGDGTAVVDLSREASEQLAGGVSAEMGLLYSLTRSLTHNLSNVQSVRFLVDGKERPTLAGHVSIMDPFR